LLPSKVKSISHQGHVVETDASLSPVAANLIALTMMPGLAAILMLPYWRIWGGVSFSNGASQLLRPIILIPVVAVSVVVHEALHALGFVRFGCVEWRAIRFGFHWKALAPYAHCDQPVSALAYRKSIVLPVLTLGIVPCGLGLIFGTGGLYVYGVLMSVAAIGDLVLLWVIRRVPSHAYILDHPDRPGCFVLRDAEPTDST
jgi:hypothetical protein